MTTTINADTSTGGAVISGDASGVLGLQAAGSTQVTINTSGVVLANPLPVGSGGTGATSLSGITAGSATNLAGGSAGTIPYQTASGTTAMLAAGSAGQVLQSNGAAAPSWVAASSGFSQAQIFTSSGSFTVPASGKFKVTIIGGGGSGSSYNSGTIGSGSGAGGGTVIKWFSGATPGDIATVTIGSGGAGVSNAAGNSGGNSTFALSGFSTLTAGGGGGGYSYLSQYPSAGGTASNGDINVKGGGGSNVIDSGGASNQVGFAGSTLLGFGLVEMINYNNTGTNGIYGAGSCGRYNNQTTGAGGAGICIVEY